MQVKLAKLDISPQKKAENPVPVASPRNGEAPHVRQDDVPSSQIPRHRPTARAPVRRAHGFVAMHIDPLELFIDELRLRPALRNTKRSLCSCSTFHSFMFKSHRRRVRRSEINEIRMNWPHACHSQYDFHAGENDMQCSFGLLWPYNGRNAGEFARMFRSLEVGLPHVGSGDFKLFKRRSAMTTAEDIRHGKTWHQDIAR